MKLYYVYLLVFSLLQLQPSNVVSTCKPLSKIKETTSIPKTFGETFTLWWPSHPNTTTNQVDGNIYNFAKISGRSEYIHQGRVFSKAISDVNDTATYCCVPYCAKDTEPCCVNIGVYSEITFDMNDTAYSHQHYTASCTVTANPRMNVYIYTQGCDFQYNTLQIDEYTTKAIIMIYNITSECRKITCVTNLSQKSRTVDLLPRLEATEVTPMRKPMTQLPITQSPNEVEADNSHHSSYSVGTHLPSHTF